MIALVSGRKSTDVGSDCAVALRNGCLSGGAPFCNAMRALICMAVCASSGERDGMDMARNAVSTAEKRPAYTLNIEVEGNRG